MGIILGIGTARTSDRADQLTVLEFSTSGIPPPDATHGTLDYQFVADPTFNQARGPVSVFGARLHVNF